MSEPQRVITSDGRQGVIVGDSNPSRDDPRFVEVRMEDGTLLHVPAELLELRPDGVFALLVGMAEIEGQTAGVAHADMAREPLGRAVGAHVAGEAPGSPTDAVPFGDASGISEAGAQRLGIPERSEHTVGEVPGSATGGRRFVLPVVVEELEVGRRAVTTGIVRVRKRVNEREEVLDETVTREDVHVERVPVGQMVDSPPAMRSEGETLIIPVLEEVLVVEKRLRLKEEVRVTWRRVVEPAPQRVVLRDEEVVVERLPPDAGADAGSPVSP